MNTQQIKINTAIGWLSVQYHEQGIFDISLNAKAGRDAKAPDALGEKIQQQITAYFTQGKNDFDLPLQLAGTAFQQKVWASLRRIRPGQVVSYGELAKKLHTSPRAVGNACRANPVPLIVPCHRVVAANALGGFAGKTAGRMTNIKKWLLDHEGVQL